MKRSGANVDINDIKLPAGYNLNKTNSFVPQTIKYDQQGYENWYDAEGNWRLFEQFGLTKNDSNKIPLFMSTGSNYEQLNGHDIGSMNFDGSNNHLNLTVTVDKPEASHEVTKLFCLPIQVIGIFRGDNASQHKLDNPFLGTTIPIYIQFTYDTSIHKLINCKVDSKWDTLLKSIPLTTSKNASAGYVINDELTKINNKLNVAHLVVNSDTNHPYFTIDNNGKNQAINIFKNWLAKENNGKGWDGNKPLSNLIIPYYVIYDQINNNTFTHTDKLVPKVTSDFYEGSTKINSLDEQATGLHFGIQLVRHNTLRAMSRNHGLDATLHAGDNEQISDLKFVVKTGSSLPNGITITDEGLDPKSTYLGKMTSVDRETDTNALRSLAGDTLIHDNSAIEALNSFEKGRTYEIFTVSVNNPYKTFLGNPVYVNGVASPKLVAVDVTNNVISFVSGNYSPEFNLLVGLMPIYKDNIVEQSRTVTFVDKTDNKTLKTVTQNVNRQQTNEVSRTDGHIINAGTWMVQSVSDPVLINMNDFDNWYTLDHIQTEDGTILENTNEISLPSDLTSDKLDMPNIVVYLNRCYDTKDVNVQRILHFDDKADDQVVLNKTFTFKHFKDNPWMLEDGRQSVSIDTANVAVVTGYVADKASFDKVDIDHVSNNVKQEITYHHVGRIIPTDSSGKSMPDAPTPDYINDPSDPTKVTAHQNVPSIPGYFATVSYISPDDETKDTFVPYVLKHQETGTPETHELPKLDPDKLKNQETDTPASHELPKLDPDELKNQETDTPETHDLPKLDPDKLKHQETDTPETHDLPKLDPDELKNQETDIPETHELPKLDPDELKNQETDIPETHELPKLDPDELKNQETDIPETHDLPKLDPDELKNQETDISASHELPKLDPDELKNQETDISASHELPKLDPDELKNQETDISTSHELPKLDPDELKNQETDIPETHELPKLDPDKIKHQETDISASHELPKLDSDKVNQNDTKISIGHIGHKLEKSHLDNNDQLPQMGNKPNIAGIIGLMLISISSLLGIDIKKQKS